MALKRLIQRAVNRFGYRIERIRPPIPGIQLVLIDLVLQIISVERGDRVTFIEIGANDGQREDPLFPWLTRFRWQGLLVEPQPQMCDRLRKLWKERKEIQIVQAAVGSKLGMATLWCVEDQPGDENRSGLASFNRAALLERRGDIPELESRLRPCEVPVLTFGSLLDRFAITDVQVLQIDTEGYDAEVIKMIDFSRIKPEVINYEHCNLSWEDQYTSRHILGDYGYGFATYHGDTLAVRLDVLPASLDRSICQL